MPSKRLISIEFFRDHNLAKNTSRTARWLYTGLWCLADDQGVVRHDVPNWKLEIFPWDDDVSFEVILACFDELVTVKRAVIFQAGKEHYVWLPKLLKNQPGLAKICKLFPAPPADLQVKLLGDDGANEYRGTIARLDARREAAKKRAAESAQAKSVEAPVAPANVPATAPKAETRVPPEVARAADQLLGRPMSPKERSTIVATLTTDGVKAEWLPRAFEETSYKRSVEYACTVVKRWATEGLPTTNGRGKPAEEPVVYPELPLLPDIPKRVDQPRDPARPPVLRVIHDRMAELDAAEGSEKVLTPDEEAHLRTLQAQIDARARRQA